LTVLCRCPSYTGTRQGIASLEFRDQKPSSLWFALSNNYRPTTESRTLVPFCKSSSANAAFSTPFKQWPSITPHGADASALERPKVPYPAMDNSIIKKACCHSPHVASEMAGLTLLTLRFCLPEEFLVDLLASQRILTLWRFLKKAQQWQAHLLCARRHSDYERVRTS